MSLSELQTGDFVRITWPDGSMLAGYVNVSENGVVSVRFGANSGDDDRWISLGFVGKAHSFVACGSLERTPTQGPLS